MNLLLMISKNDRYGAQRIFLDQVAVLHRMGHDVTVVCRGDGFVTDSVKAMGVSYTANPMSGLRDIFSLRHCVKKNNMDVIHTTLDRADHFGLLVAKITGIPVVSTMMVPRYHAGFRFANRVVVLSNKQRDLLIGKGIRTEKIIVIRPGIDVDRFSRPDSGKRDAWKRKLKADLYNIVFCHIASLIPRKAHEVSLDLIAACKKRGKNPLLVVIGDPLTGEYYESLMARIKALGLAENVVFTGWTSDVPEILSLSHFTILPSENEALGVVLMEGMASGTPIVARAGEGGAELIDEYGMGFQYRSDEGVGLLADALLDLAHNKARFSVMSERCREIARKDFSVARFGEKLIDLYMELGRRN